MTVTFDMSMREWKLRIALYTFLCIALGMIVGALIR